MKEAEGLSISCHCYFSSFLKFLFCFAFISMLLKPFRFGTGFWSVHDESHGKLFEMNILSRDAFLVHCVQYSYLALSPWIY